MSRKLFPHSPVTDPRMTMVWQALLKSLFVVDVTAVKHHIRAMCPVSPGPRPCFKREGVFQSSGHREVCVSNESRAYLRAHLPPDIVSQTGNSGKELARGDGEAILPEVAIWNTLERGHWTIPQTLEGEVYRPVDSGDLCRVPASTVRWQD